MEDLPDSGFAVIRCTDRAVIAYIDNFPRCDRALMYCRGNMCSFMPLRDDEIVGSPSCFTMMLEKAGYRLSPPSAIID